MNILHNHGIQTLPNTRSLVLDIRSSSGFSPSHFFFSSLFLHLLLPAAAFSSASFLILLILRALSLDLFLVLILRSHHLLHGFDCQLYSSKNNFLQPGHNSILRASPVSAADHQCTLSSSEFYRYLNLNLPLTAILFILLPKLQSNVMLFFHSLHHYLQCYLWHLCNFITLCQPSPAPIRTHDQECKSDYISPCLHLNCPQDKTEGTGLHSLTAAYHRVSPISYHAYVPYILDY